MSHCAMGMSCGDVYCQQHRLEAKSDGRNAPLRQEKRDERDERSVCQCGQPKYSDANSCGRCHESQLNWGTR